MYMYIYIHTHIHINVHIYVHTYAYTLYPQGHGSSATIPTGWVQWLVINPQNYVSTVTPVPGDRKPPLRCIFRATGLPPPFRLSGARAGAVARF